MTSDLKEELLYICNIYQVLISRAYINVSQEMRPSVRRPSVCLTTAAEVSRCH